MTLISRKIRSFMNRHSLFMLFLRSYVLIVAILLVFSLLSYTVAIDRISGSVRQLNTAVLDGISATLDNQFREVEQLAFRLTSLGTTMKLAYLDRSNVDYYPEMTRYVKNLWTLWLENNPLTPRMYVYFARSGIIASPATFYDYDSFYGTFFTYGDLDAGAFAELIQQDHNHMRYLPAEQAWLNDDVVLQGTHEVVLYLYHLKSQSSADQPPGAVLFLIDTREILKMLLELEIGDGGLAVVLDHEDNIVALLDRGSGLGQDQIRRIINGDQTELAGQMLVSSVSDHNGWTYLALGNPDVVMKPVAALRQIFILLFLASLCGGMIMAFSMARKRSLPLFNLAHRLNPAAYAERTAPASPVKAYEPLEQGVAQVLQTNLSMQARLREINPLLLSAFMHQLFNGGFADEAEIQQASGRFGVHIPQQPYCLVSFRLPQVRELLLQSREHVIRTMMAQNAVLECLRYLFDEPLLVYQASLDETIWIHSLSGQDSEQELLDLLDRIVRWLDEHKTAISIRYSRPFIELSNSWWELAQLRHARPETWQQAGKSSIEFAWTDPDPSRSQYMLLVELVLVSMYRSGDEKMLARFIDILQKEIFDEGQFDHSTRRNLLQQFGSIAARLTEQPVRPADGPDESLAGYFGQIRTAILESCSESNNSRVRTGSFLINKILTYIDQQIFNAELSMTLIADAMNISESYLSRFFKDQCGDTLANYIENKRIRKSEELLLQTMLNISEIAGQVGYHSDHVFRRAFRRVNGMSPNEYRERNSSPSAG